MMTPIFDTLKSIINVENPSAEKTSAEVPQQEDRRCVALHAVLPVVLPAIFRQLR